MQLRRSVGFWTLALGIVGGAAGFLGPMILNPGANQGPLLGILITGPGGALAGAVLGFLFRVFPFSDSVRGQALVLACTLLGLGTLWYAMPEPVIRARVVDATIGNCRPVGELLPARIAHWEERIAEVKYTAPRDGWQADTRRMLREQPGVIVELDVARSNAILEHRRPWEQGRLSAQGWKRIDDTQRYFGGGSCASYPRGRHVLLAPSPMGGANRSWPPAELPDFLGVQVLEAVPARYLALVK